MKSILSNYSTDELMNELESRVYKTTSKLRSNIAELDGQRFKTANGFELRFQLGRYDGREALYVIEEPTDAIVSFIMGDYNTLRVLSLDPVYYVRDLNLDNVQLGALSEDTRIRRRYKIPSGLYGDDLKDWIATHSDF